MNPIFRLIHVCFLRVGSQLCQSICPKNVCGGPKVPSPMKNGLKGESWQNRPQAADICKPQPTSVLSGAKDLTLVTYHDPETHHGQKATVLPPDKAISSILSCLAILV
jgi:hypothetical protein